MNRAAIVGGLIVLWVLGLWFHIGGAYIHILPVIAMTIVIVKVVAGRPGEL